MNGASDNAADMTPDRTRLALLVEQYVQGELSQEYRDELAGQVENNAETREMFLNQARLHLMLKATLNREDPALARNRAELIVAGFSNESARPRLSVVSAAREPARKFRISRILVPLAAAACLVAAWVMVFAGRSGARLESGLARAERGKTVVVLKRGDVVKKGDRLTSQAESSLRWDDGSVIRISGGTTLGVGDDKRFFLDHGSVNVMAFHAMTFNEGQYDQAAILSTEFDLLRSAEKSVLRVGNGRIRFGLGADAVVVDAARMSEVRPGGRPSVPVAFSVPATGRPGGSGSEQVLAEDSFDGPGFSDMWTFVGKRARLGGSSVFLSVDSTEPEVKALMISRGFRFEGKTLEVRLKEQDPVPLQAALRLELVDETGSRLCRLDFLRSLGKKFGGSAIEGAASIGDGAVSKTILPAGDSSVFVGQDGKVALVTAYGKPGQSVILCGELKKAPSSISLRISTFWMAGSSRSTSNPGTIWLGNVLVARHDSWPAISSAK